MSMPNQRAAATFFASYRRDDEPHFVGRVVGDLRSCFGPSSVFHDIDGINEGEMWPQALRRALQGSVVLLAFIGKKWHNSWSDDCGPRLWNPNDWVRKEICTALDSAGKVVIPVLVGDTPIPRSGALPKGCSLNKLNKLQASRIGTLSYKADIERLIFRLGELTNSLAKVRSWQSYSTMQVEERFSESFIRGQQSNE